METLWYREFIQAPEGDQLHGPVTQMFHCPLTPNLDPLIPTRMGQQYEAALVQDKPFQCPH